MINERNATDSRDFATDVKQFAKEFETAIEILEDRYVGFRSMHAEEMRGRIREMQGLRNPWKTGEGRGPTVYQIFTILHSVAVHLLPEREPKEMMEEIHTAVMFYLSLGRMRLLTKNPWLSCAIYDMEREVVRALREAHELTKPTDYDKNS